MSEARDFWSRRKARVAEETEAEQAAVEAQARAAEQAEKTDEEILADLGLPDPEALQPGDDFSAFMARAVPDRIRSRALRKLWLTNPVLANVDGLVDYGEDFTDAACVIENLTTSYQVGKGLQAHVDEMARQAESAAVDAGDADAAADEVEDAPEAQPVPGDDALLAEAATAGDAPDPAGAAQVLADAEEAAPAPRRRMRFSFNEEEVAQA